MAASPAYLDWNATAPLRSSARAALVACAERVGNPSSVHAFGREARRQVEQARAVVASLVGAGAGEVTFTSGGTEANLLALAGIDLPLAVSAVEHPSVLAARADARILPVDGEGRVRLEALEALLAETGPMLVSVMAANNETGVIQPVRDVAGLVHAHGGILHCDAVQAIGRIDADLFAMGVDLATVSAHKIGGPQGVGALVARPGLPQLRAMLRGGGQEGGRRAGTENVAGIVAFGAAARELREDGSATDGIVALRDDLERQVRRVVPHSVIVAEASPRLPNTSCIALPGAEASTLVMALDLAGIAVSAGAACSSGKVRASHVLRAMGVPDDVARGAIRVSLGASTTAAEIESFIAAWTTLAARLSSSRAAA